MVEALLGCVVVFVPPPPACRFQGHGLPCCDVRAACAGVRMAELPQVEEEDEDDGQEPLPGVSLPLSPVDFAFRTTLLLAFL